MVTKERLTSPIVKACEDAWHAIQRREGDVPPVAIVVASRNRKPANGHYARSTWVIGTNGSKPKVSDFRAEVLIAAEGLNRGGRGVFETLLHEACHGMAVVRKIRDTDAQGKYHNRHFRGLAEGVGLVCESNDRYGCMTPDVTDEAALRYRVAIERLDEAIKLHRVDSLGGKKKPPDRNALKLGCDCGRLIRVHRKVLDQGPIMCGACGSDFLEFEED